MTTENVDIIVSEKGAKVVKRSIDDIAASTDKADASVNELKDALSALGGGASLKDVVNELKTLVEITRQAAGVQGALQASLSDTAAEVGKITAAQNIMAEAIDNTNAKIYAGSAALDNFNSHVVAYDNFQKATADAAKEADQLAARVLALKQSVDPLAVSIDNANEELMEAKALFAVGAIGANDLAQAEEVLTQRVNTLAAAQMRMNALHKAGGKAAGLEAYEMLNLSRQFSDIGVTAAMGMNPLMILIQQGPQIADVFQNAASRGVTFGGALKSIAIQLGLLKVVQVESTVATAAAAVANEAEATTALHASAANETLAVTTAQAATATAALAMAQEHSAGAAVAAVAGKGAIVAGNEAIAASATEAAVAETVALAPLALILAGIAAGLAVVALGFGLAAREANKGTGDMTKGLNLTEKQMDKLKTKGTDLNVSLGDSFKGFFVTVGDSIKNNFGPALDWLSKAWTWTMDFITGSLANTLKFLTGAWYAEINVVKVLFKSLPAALEDAFITGVNAAIKAINWLDEKIVGFINSLGGELKTFDLAEMINPATGAVKELGAQLQDAVVDGFKDGAKAVDDFGAAWEKNSKKIAQARILKDAGKDKGTKQHGFDPVKELQNVNRELDNQLARTSMLSQAAEVQQKVDAITQKFASHGIQLDKEVVAGLRNKIVAIQDATRVQAQMNVIYDQFHKPLREFNDGIDAADKLVNQHKITLEQYNETLNVLALNYKQATDPMYGFNKALQDQNGLFGLTGQALDTATYMQGVQNDMQTKWGKSIYDTNGALTAEAQALKDSYEATQRKVEIQDKLNGIYGQTKGAVEGLTAQQAALGIALQQHLITQEAYNAAMLQTQIQIAQVQNQAGQSDWATIMTASLDGVMNGFKSSADSIATILSDTFSTLVDGIADSTAKAIVSGDNLQESLANVAKTILTQLISSLIKLGVQYAINATLGSTIASTQTAASSAMGAATALAWAPAAAAVSLATFGANAATASAAMAGTYALSQSLAAMSFAGAFDSGGQFMVQGQSGVDKNLVGMALSKGERVTVETPYQQRNGDSKSSDGSDSGSGDSGGQQRVQVDVGVSVDDDGNLKAYVKGVAQSTSVAVTQQGLEEFNNNLPDRVDEINKKPNWR